jgi:hypothetical protein
MKFRTVSIWLLGVAAALAALPSYARGVIIEGSTCGGIVAPTGSLWIGLNGTGSKGNQAKSGLNLPVLSCTPDAELQALPYKATAPSLLFIWVDLSVAQDTLQDFASLAAAEGLSGLSNQGPSVPDSTAAVAAQLAVLKLTGSNKGDYEIIFSYELNLNGFSTPLPLPNSVCDNEFKPIKPSFTWYGTTYEFTGVGGVSPCDAAATNDFVFDKDGNLIGYRSPTDIANNTVTEGALPPGWAIQ